MHIKCIWMWLAVPFFFFSYSCDSSLCCPVCSAVEMPDSRNLIISLEREGPFHFLQTSVKCFPDVLTLSCVSVSFPCRPSLSWRKHTTNKREMRCWTAGWFLIWFDFSRRMAQALQNSLGEVKKRPGRGPRLLSLSYSFFFLPAAWNLCSKDFGLVSPSAWVWSFMFLPLLQ